MQVIDRAGIGGPENRAYVEGASKIVEHDVDGIPRNGRAHLKRLPAIVWLTVGAHGREGALHTSEDRPPRRTDSSESRNPMRYSFLLNVQQRLHALLESANFVAVFEPDQFAQHFHLQSGSGLTGQVDCIARKATATEVHDVGQQ